MSLEARELGSTADALRHVARGLQESAQAQRGMAAVLPSVRGANDAIRVEGVAGGVAQPISGTVAVTGVATQATLALILAELITLNATLAARLPAALDAGGGMKVHET